MAFLLDVNVLVALAWPLHTQHETALRWFQKHRSQGWATCPITQAGMLRLLANPAVTGREAGMEAAQLALTTAIQQPQHTFLPDSLPLVEALQLISAPLYGHRQVTVAYLLALALSHRMRLATLDRSLLAWLPPAGPARAACTLIA